MNYKAERIFLKDTEKLNKKLKENLINFLNFVDKIEDIDDISNFYDIKKLKSFDLYFRIRFWDYRLVFKFNKKEIILLRFLHRKDIYKKI